MKQRLVFVSGEIRNVIIEECAVAAEQQDRAGHEWVADSLWANILRRAGANVRKLKSAAPGAPPSSQQLSTTGDSNAR